MRILGVDTTRKNAYVFLINNDTIKVDSLSEDEKQSENLMFHIDKLLEDNDLSLKDINLFAVVSGPGSFTGIRVGIATIKAFALAFNKPIICANLFEIVSSVIENGVIISECTSNSVYFCEISDYNIVKVGVLENNELNNISNKIIISEEHLLTSRAYNLNVLNNYIDLVFNKFIDMADKQQFTNSPEPYYIQLSQAERNLELKNDKKSS